MSDSSTGAAAPRRKPRVGELLDGKYRVERVLGVGGMGAVVAARHVRLDQLVALKYLLPHARAVPAVAERFAREARAAARIRGRHAAHIIDVGSFEDGTPYMVLEYLDGHDLAQLLEQRGRLPMHDAVGYVLQACEALAEAHRARIVHRDLKPANLFLAKQPDKRSIIKVLDFGISKIQDDASVGRLTGTSELIGTAYYMSPEQLRASPDVDARADIWALGVILYELLAGRPPFAGVGLADVMQAIVFGDPQDLAVIRPDLPSGLCDAITRCLEKDPEARYASVVDLARALEPYARPEERDSVSRITRVLASLHPPAARAESACDHDAASPDSESSDTTQVLRPSTLDVLTRPRPASPRVVAVVCAALAISIAAGVMMTRRSPIGGRSADRPDRASGLVAGSVQGAPAEASRSSTNIVSTSPDESSASSTGRRVQGSTHAAGAPRDAKLEAHLSSVAPRALAGAARSRAASSGPDSEAPAPTPRAASRDAQRGNTSERAPTARTPDGAPPPTLGPTNESAAASASRGSPSSKGEGAPLAEGIAGSPAASPSTPSSSTPRKSALDMGLK